MITQSTNVEFSISCNYIETVSTDVRTTIRAPNGFNEYSREAISMLHLRRYSGHEMYVTITRIIIIIIIEVHLACSSLLGPKLPNLLERILECPALHL